jgi:hypothetical protein
MDKVSTIFSLETFDQDTLTKMSQHDPLVVFYRAFFELIGVHSLLAHRSQLNAAFLLILK